MRAKKASRFGYLSGGVQPEAPVEREPDQPKEEDSEERRAPERRGVERSGGEEGIKRASTPRRNKSGTRKTPPADLRTVPKGQGRMKQDRSQLNVRIPTALKRQATAKAVLEGREMWDVVEELLKGYLSD